MRLVITRPADDAQRQAAKLHALGHEPLIHPLMEIVYSEVTPLRLAGVQALIATSRNALHGLARNGAFDEAKRLPIYCVGASTGKFAHELGFSRVFSGEGTAKELASLIVHALDPGTGAVLYLTGHHLAFDLERPLKAAGFFVPRVILYEAREIGRQGSQHLADRLHEGVDGVILMSPRTSEIFARMIKTYKLERATSAILCYCYSEAVAKPLGEISGLTVAVSSHPTEADLMELIGPASLVSAALSELKEALGKH